MTKIEQKPETTSSLEPLDDDSIALLRAALEEIGEPAIVVETQLSKTAILRALAGLRVNAGTRGLITEFLKPRRRAARRAAAR